MNFRCAQSLPTIPILTLLGVLMVGCGHAHVSQTTWLAVIERIDDQAGDHYSPTKGRKPLLRLQLRLSAHGKSNHSAIIKLMVLDLYSPQVHGEVGDTVSFMYSGTLPANGILWFEQLDDYRIVVRQAQPSESSS